LPDNLADLDLLTPYVTLFRYEALSAGLGLDRNRFFNMVQALREMVAERLAK
jgi:hypothetical protein